jgi:multidrug efflux pump subunit AcrA (membrane-fusion protein)
MSQTAVDRPPVGPETAPPRPQPTRTRAAIRPLSALRRAAPTLLVTAALAGLGYYGHRTGWKLPKFSALTGAAAATRDDWCEEHNVPESKCVECSPDLMPKGPDYGWDAEHGVHDCPLHHPDVAQLKEPPVVTPDDFARAERALALRERPANNAACAFYRKRIQFASVEAVRQAGVDVALVEMRPVEEAVSANGEITYDQTRVANLAPRAAGVVWRVEKIVGDRVRAGEVLALVDSADVGRAKTDLVQALAQETVQRQARERLKGLTEKGITAGRQAQEAEAEYVKARAAVLGASQTLANLGLPVSVPPLRDLSQDEVVERLRFLGLPASLAAALKDSAATANLVPVVSPIEGVVVPREAQGENSATQAVAGEVVDPSRPLFRVADTSRMWLTLSVPVEDASLVKKGLPVRFRPDGGPEEVSGAIDWISTAADQRTRMVEVRATLPNPDGRLRDETFGAGRIVLRREEAAVAVPEGAVHSEGCCHVVFVRDKGYFDSPESPKVFHVRTVRPGPTADGFTEVIVGLLPGEVVATAGSDVLRAQLLKNSLGEGCTCGQ